MLVIIVVVVVVIHPFYHTTDRNLFFLFDSEDLHDHSKLWNLERIVSGSLLAVIPGAFLINSPWLDYVLALSLVAHVHWGIEAITVDYVRPALFGLTVPKLALGAVYLLSALTLAGLFYFNYTDVGLTTAIKMFFNK